MKRVHLLPNLVTAFGLICGLFVIFRATMMENPTYETLQMLVVVMAMAAIADVLDGALARAVHGESDFGGFFDSLSDAVTFGVAPSVIVIKTLQLNPEAELALLVMSGVMVYSLCGVLRLVRFNATEKELKKRTGKGSSTFTGLPIPAAAGAVVCLNLFLVCPEFTHFVVLEKDVHSFLLSGVLFTLGYFMISRWKFPSAKTFHFRIPSFQWVFATVVFGVLLFFGLFTHFAVFAFILSWGYLLVSWGL